MQAISRIMLRPVGSPIRWASQASAAASVALSGLQLSWVPQIESHQIAIVVLTFAVPLELLASVFGFLSRDSVGGTGMGLLAGSWLATGTPPVTSDAGARSQTLGLLLFFVCAALMVPTCAAALGKVVAAIVLFAAAARFGLTGIYEYAGGTGWENVSGSWGVGMGGVRSLCGHGLRGRRHPTQDVLPVGRRGFGKAAPGGGLSAELERIEHEAGVREQL